MKHATSNNGIQPWRHPDCRVCNSSRRPHISRRYNEAKLDMTEVHIFSLMAKGCNIPISLLVMEHHWKMFKLFMQASQSSRLWVFHLAFRLTATETFIILKPNCSMSGQLYFISYWMYPVWGYHIMLLLLCWNICYVTYQRIVFFIL